MLVQRLFSISGNLCVIPNRAGGRHQRAGAQSAVQRIPWAEPCGVEQLSTKFCIWEEMALCISRYGLGADEAKQVSRKRPLRPSGCQVEGISAVALRQRRPTAYWVALARVVGGLREVVLHLYPALVRPYLEYWVPSCVFLYRKDIDLPEWQYRDSSQTLNQTGQRGCEISVFGDTQNSISHTLYLVLLVLDPQLLLKVGPDTLQISLPHDSMSVV